MAPWDSLRAWEREEDVQALRAGLFHSSQQWFRHSAYHLIEGDRGQLYIAPQPGAILEWYKPFEEYPDILLDFYELSLLAYRLIDKKQAANSRISYQQLADNLLEFVSHYGPFGLFWQDVTGIRQEYGQKGPLGIVVALQQTNLLAPGRRKLPYDEYAKYFFPRLKAPFPSATTFSSRASRKEFLSKYSEPVDVLVAHMSFWEIPYHIVNLKEFQNSNAKISDPWVTDRRLKGLAWAKHLETGISSLGVKLVNKEGRWQLAWEFRTLLDGLQIMHINNIAGTMGQRVKICALPGCNRPHLKKGLYCRNKCTNVAAKRAQREREKEVFAEFAVVHKEGRTWEELLQLWIKEFPEGQQYKTVKGFRRAVIAAAKEFGLDCSGLLDTE